MPAGIERLALVSTTPRFLAAPGWPFGAAPALLARLAEQLRRGDAQAIDEFCKLQVRGNTPRTAARVLKALRAALKRGSAQPAALLHGLERLRNADLRPALSMVRVPTLVIAGTHDRIVRPAASRALAALADARYLEFAGAAHAPFLSHPRRFAEVVGGFLRG
jgi:pimeloyl-[acyl-carrier protein] methyl ester esterase